MLIQMTAGDETLIIDTEAAPKSGDRVVAKFADSWRLYRLGAGGKLSGWDPSGIGSGTAAAAQAREIYRVIGVQYA